MSLKESKMLAFWVFFSSFEFDYLSNMWYSDAVAVESAGQTSEMKTDAILWYSK